jgi:uncharacterized protein
MQSIRPQQRIEVVDILRGYALMGLFLIHMVEYFELYWYRPEPGPVNTWTFFFFGGKAYAMFALLFGVSFYIIMESQARKGVDFAARFLWRLAVLFGLGFIHGLIYGGDILQILAITGLILVPLYRRRNTTVLALALFFIFQGPALIAYALVNALPGLSYEQPLHSGAHPQVFEVYANGSFVEVLRTNLWLGQYAKWAFMVESGRVWNIIGLSLFGFLLARSAFFTDLERYRPVYVKALPIALALAAIFHLFGSDIAGLAQGTESRWIIGHVLSSYSNHTLIAASLLTLMLLYWYTPAAKVLRLIAPCGRMSLTIYMSQSFFLVPVFYGYGIGAFAFIGQVRALGLGIVLWCLQVWFAHYWIRNFHYGPMEWLWRSATWLRSDIPLRKRSGNLEPSAASA